MIYHIVTTQPDIYKSFLETGLIARGIDRKIIDIKVHNLHDYAFDAHHSVDDTPAGGGAGMVLKVDVMANALTQVKSSPSRQGESEAEKLKVKSKTILLTPQGKNFDQNKAKELAKLDEIILIAGRFEGYDERIRDLVDEEISIGDFVLTSGDIPAQIIIDATSRMICGFIEKNESTIEESFSYCPLSTSPYPLLEYPQYTRPVDFEGKKIPEVLLSGNHGEIAKWRHDQALKRTHLRRPDLIC